ncbi:hypothetical protein DID75_04845 [Candidatus Marinamargulisbacteria bacterium SCGC AG-410-N11]|nr:hypothetical protein DID75_04845 [Candidatus Marinamargulisbacteria bacterium SCGC AG-410-N11]
MVNSIGKNIPDKENVTPNQPISSRSRQKSIKLKKKIEHIKSSLKQTSSSDEINDLAIQRRSVSPNSVVIDPQDLEINIKDQSDFEKRFRPRTHGPNKPLDMQLVKGIQALTRLKDNPDLCLQSFSKFSESLHELSRKITPYLGDSFDQYDYEDHNSLNTMLKDNVTQAIASETVEFALADDGPGFLSFALEVNPDGSPERVVSRTQIQDYNSNLNYGEQTVSKRQGAYSSAYKWDLFKIGADSFKANQYDIINTYQEALDIDPDLPIASKLQALDRFEDSEESITVRINSNSPAIEKSISDIAQELKDLLLIKATMDQIQQTNQDLRQSTQSTPIISENKDVPLMQPAMFNLAAKSMAEHCLEQTIMYLSYESELSKTLRQLNENTLADNLLNEGITFDEKLILLKTAMETRDSELFDIIDNMDDGEEKDVIENTRLLYNYITNKLKIEITLDDKEFIFTNNDSIYHEASHLLVTKESTSNRDSNIFDSYRALIKIKQNNTANINEDIIIAKSAYTQASSTQAMYHTHWFPGDTKQGRKLIPAFEKVYQNVEELPNVTMSSNDSSKDILKLTFSGSADTIRNNIEKLDQVLNRCFKDTHSDANWSLRTNIDGTIDILINLRASNHNFTLSQETALQNEGLYKKMGVPEVFGAKTSKINSNSAQFAFEICTKDEFSTIKDLILKTPLYMVQTDPESMRTSYFPFEESLESEPPTGMTQEQYQIFAHVLTFIDLYDCKKFMDGCFELYKPEATQIDFLYDLLRTSFS